MKQKKPVGPYANSAALPGKKMDTRHKLKEGVAGHVALLLSEENPDTKDGFVIGLTDPKTGLVSKVLFRVGPDGELYAKGDKLVRHAGNSSGGEGGGNTDLADYVPITRLINGKPLDSDIELVAEDVGALPADFQSLTVPETLISEAVRGQFQGAAFAEGSLNDLVKGHKRGDWSFVTHGVNIKDRFPAPNSANGCLSFNIHGSIWGHQIGMSGDGKLYHRSFYNGTPTEWAEIYTANNPPPASGGGDVDLSGLVPESRTINGKALDADIELTAKDVGAMAEGGAYGTVTLSNFFRSTGATGWMNASHGGGIYMKDSDFVRVWNGKKFMVESQAEDSIATEGGISVKGVITNKRAAGQFRAWDYQNNDLTKLNTGTAGDWGFTLMASLAANKFPTTSNANAVFTIATHSGGHGHQLGFSSNGRLYHRMAGSGGAYNDWAELYSSNNPPPQIRQAERDVRDLNRRVVELEEQLNQMKAMMERMSQ